MGLILGATMDEMPFKVFYIIIGTIKRKVQSSWNPARSLRRLPIDTVPPTHSDSHITPSCLLHASFE